MSTLLFTGWYCIPYRHVQSVLADYQKTIAKNAKHCLQAHTLDRSCSAQEESLSLLHTNYQLCISPTKECNDNDAMIYNIITLLEKNNLILCRYNQISKEKNESYVRFTTTISFQGIITNVLIFFEQLCAMPTLIIPTTIELHTNNQQLTDVVTNLSWIIYR